MDQFVWVIGGRGEGVAYVVYFLFKISMWFSFLLLIKLIVRRLYETVQNLPLVDCAFIATEYIFKR